MEKEDRVSQSFQTETAFVAPTSRDVIEDDGDSTLPLESIPELLPRGIVLRLPVRAEHVTVSKRTFVVEEAVVRAGSSRRVVHVEDSALREELAIDAHGGLDVTGSTANVRRSNQPDHQDHPLL